MKNGLYSMKEAADFLSISKNTLARRIESGDITPDRIDTVNGYKYFSQRTLNLYLNSRYRVASPGQVIDLPSKRGFTFIDLFAGIGGIRLGFESAGGRCVFSSEIDSYAVKTYSHMFKDSGENIPFGDITKIPEQDIPQHDILCAGFPCQPFSIAGVSKYESLGWEHGFAHKTKGTLFFDIARIIKYHQPKAFFLENVKNLRSHDKGRTWKVIESTLSELGYIIYARVFDAQLLLPQHRERIFIVGIRSDLNVSFSFPEIRPSGMTVRSILDDAPDPKYTLTDHLWEYLQKYAEKHRAKGNGFGYGMTDLDGITRTLSARYYKDGSEILIPQEGKNPRRLTPAECARLQGFPRRFWTPVVSDTQAYKQFGNAVPVPLVAIVAERLRMCMAGSGIFETDESGLDVAV